MNEQDTRDKKAITNLYAAFIVGILTQFVPVTSIQGAGIFILLGALAAAYILRRGRPEDSLRWNHATYIIGTFWIWSTFLSIGIGIAGYIVYVYGDHSLIRGFMDQAAMGAFTSEQDVMNLFRAYMMANLKILIISATVFVGPCIVYIVYRFARGISRATKGYRITNPKGWI